MEEFNEVTEELGLVDTIGSSCYQHTNDSDDITNDTNCSQVYTVCRDLILRTGLTTRACLGGYYTLDCHGHGNGSSHPAGELIMITIMTINQGCIFCTVYGLGFLSTLIISVASQLGVIIILCSYNNRLAKYLISLLIAVGISSLVTDAILHLIPKVYRIQSDYM